VNDGKHEHCLLGESARWSIFYWSYFCRKTR